MVSEREKRQSSRIAAKIRPQRANMMVTQSAPSRLIFGASPKTWTSALALKNQKRHYRIPLSCEDASTEQTPWMTVRWVFYHLQKQWKCTECSSLQPQILEVDQSWVMGRFSALHSVISTCWYWGLLSFRRTASKLGVPQRLKIKGYPWCQQSLSPAVTVQPSPRAR